MKKMQETFLAAKPSKLLSIALAAFLILVVASITFAQLSSSSLASGETMAVSCNGERLQIIPVASKQIEVTCVAGNAPEPPVDPEPTPEPEPTSEPNPPTNPEPVPSNISIDPVAETTAVGGDADDPAIWVHPTDAGKSVIIANSKSDGIYVWNLNGELLQHLPQGTRVNNVDLRGNVVMANLRAAGKLAVFVVNPDYDPGAGNILTQIADRDSNNNDIQHDSYGFGIYQRLSDGQLFVFDKPKGGGDLVQYQVDINGSDVVVTAVRTLDYDGGVTEGMVGDDELGFFYVAEEGEAIHKFLADPSSDGSPIASFATDDSISGDREGLTLYKQAGNQGYILLSSQGNDTIKVYDRQTNALITTISHADASSTDGLDVTSTALPGFPNGMLVTHDGSNRYNIYNWADTGLGN